MLVCPMRMSSTHVGPMLMQTNETFSVFASAEFLQFMSALDVHEIHGYRPDLGFRIFSEDALARAEERTAAKTSVIQAQQAAMQS